jgi:hypothetical protein
MAIGHSRTQRGPLHNRARPLAAPATQPYWLFVLFALYGPSINIIGEFRYVEIVVLVLLMLNLQDALRYVGRWERIFVGLFLLTAFMQVISDIVNDASIDGTLKRCFTYVILALLVVAVRYLSRGDPTRLKWILAGYCLSYVTMLFIGQSASRGYAEQPWRLGLGTAATIAVAIVPFFLPRFYKLVGPALLALSAVHIAAGARSVAALVALAGLSATWASLSRSVTPQRFRPLNIVAVLLFGAVAVIGAYYGAKSATEARMLPNELQEKMELQFSNPYGLLAAGRPDTVAALYGVAKSPLLGFGSTNVDPDVYAVYLDVSNASYIWTDGYDALTDRSWSREWTLGTPSHSHVFGAWVDAGVIAALSWVAVLFASVYVLQRTMFWRHPAQPVFVLVSLLCIWDVLFSPGPHRMDLAVRLAVLIYAIELLHSYDRTQDAGGPTTSFYVPT